MTQATENIHATCLDIGGHGLLITGPSGSGKSDLALRLLTGRFVASDVLGPATLVGDDRVGVSASPDGTLEAYAIENLSGLIEVRGIGIVRLAHCASTCVRLIVHGSHPRGGAPERFPDAEDWGGFGTSAFCGVELPELHLDLRSASAPNKVLLALELVTGRRSPL